MAETGEACPGRARSLRLAGSRDRQRRPGGAPRISSTGSPARLYPNHMRDAAPLSGRSSSGATAPAAARARCGRVGDCWRRGTSSWRRSGSSCIGRRRGGGGAADASRARSMRRSSGDADQGGDQVPDRRSARRREPAALLAALERAQREEMRRGLTLVGPHRDDLAIELGRRRRAGVRLARPAAAPGAGAAPGRGPAGDRGGGHRARCCCSTTPSRSSIATCGGHVLA